MNYELEKRPRRTKDFVIKYDYTGKGAAEVTYTLK